MSTFFRPALLAVLLALPGIALSTSSPTMEKAPDFQLDAMSGRQEALAGYKGQVVMINFWATWCGPCRTEMPVLEQLHKKYKAMGFTMMGVNVEPDSQGAVKWLQATPVTFPILFDIESKVSKLYSVAGMPSTVIVDRKGNVRYVHRGYKPGDENEYLTQIRALIRE
ncbi:MAG: TlpA disulfide reductase family protein [Steroidobacteraceae bacterium]